MIPTVDTLQRAAEILRQIEALQSELTGLFSGGGSAAVPARKRRGRPPGRAASTASAAPASGKRRHQMSAEGRARIAAAAKARWARFRADKRKGGK